MSGFSVDISTDGVDISIDGAYVSPVLIRRIRLINDIIMPDCAIQETHRDTLVITEHPVEQGAAITDHAYKRPAEITVNYSWSNSSPGNDGFSETYDQDMYYQLLALQSSCEPFTVMTGKRVYNDMLIAELTVTTDTSSEYNLTTTMVIRQIIIVQTEDAPAPSSSPDNQAAPQKTAPVQKQGQKQASPVATPPPQFSEQTNYDGVSGLPPQYTVINEGNFQE
jgi:hypothetical protein